MRRSTSSRPLAGCRSWPTRGATSPSGLWPGWHGPYPSIPFLAGHSGAGDVEVNLEEAHRTPNLYLELTYSGGTPWLVERLVREVGAERIVWGSDTILFAASHQVGKVVFAEIPESAKRAILAGNARRLFGLDAAS